MSQDEKKRYLKVKFHAESLEGNPLGAPVDRELWIYLPPKYHEDESARYPVIYFLHGYGGSPERLTVFEDVETLWGGKEIVEMLRGILGFDLDETPSYRKFDQMILDGEMEPVIFVQPDACLHLKPIHDLSALGPLGETMRKGSLYVNSPYTGNYEDYIVQDVINYIDNNYRTIPNRFNRGIAGASMGGIGTITLSAKHPDKFIAASALSGAPRFFVSEYDLLKERKDPPNLIPGYVKLGFPQDALKEIMKKFWDDVLDTLDLIFSPKERRLRPTIKEEPDGTITFDRSAFENYKENHRKYSIYRHIKDHPEVFKQVHLQLKCHAHDPLAAWVEGFHEFLELLEILHDYELYTGKKYEFSPHVIGGTLTIIPAMQFCLKHFKYKQNG